MTFGQATTPIARQCIDAALAIVKQRSAAPKRPEAARKASSGWRDAPEPFRKLIARSAGLPLGVVAKMDRDLSETEKSMIRNAAARLKERADALFAL
jgi:hypothetical protein